MTMGKDGEKVVAKNVNVKTFMYASIHVFICFILFYAFMYNFASKLAML